jgi:uncharacterized membrane protein
MKNDDVAAVRPPRLLRSGRERLIQTLWFEALGLAIVSPLFGFFADTSAGESLVVLVALSIAVMGWAALYNTAFDRIEQRCTGRVASDRSPRWRVVHAVMLETSAVGVTWPLIVALTPLGWREALVVEIGLTLAYTAYGYVFHLGFDWLRPVARSAQATR